MTQCKDCNVPAPVVAHLDVLGYKSVALPGFAVPTDGQFDELAEKIIPRELESIDLCHQVLPAYVG